VTRHSFSFTISFIPILSTVLPLTLLPLGIEVYYVYSPATTSTLQACTYESSPSHTTRASFLMSHVRPRFLFFQSYLTRCPQYPSSGHSSSDKHRLLAPMPNACLPGSHLGLCQTSAKHPIARPRPSAPSRHTHGSFSELSRRLQLVVYSLIELDPHLLSDLTRQLRTMHQPLSQRVAPLSLGLTGPPTERLPIILPLPPPHHPMLAFSTGELLEDDCSIAWVPPAATQVTRDALPRHDGTSAAIIYPVFRSQYVHMQGLLHFES
jgi:hypothetical protein